MPTVLVGERADNGQLVQASGQAFEIATQSHTRKTGGDRTADAAILARSLGLGIEGFNVRRPPVQPQPHHGSAGDRRGRAPGPSARGQPAGQAESQGWHSPDLEEVATRDSGAISRHLRAGPVQHGSTLLQIAGLVETLSQNLHRVAFYRDSPPLATTIPGPNRPSTYTFGFLPENCARRQTADPCTQNFLRNLRLATCNRNWFSPPVPLAEKNC